MNEITSPQNPLRQLSFPVLEHISVQNYLMYPGTEDCPGVEHTFLPGMNVIVGINGVGKTTLLNILFRMLTGDRDLRSGRELGNAQRKLAVIDTDIFSVRVPDRARDAVATLQFRLGERRLKIKRSLRNLEVLEFDVNPLDDDLGLIIDNEERYKFAVTKYSGVDDFFDFILVLQYLMFFLEDRRTLVWDENAQFEIFRILFCPQNSNYNYKEAVNSALSADSYARNLNAVLSREQKRLNRIKKEITKSNPTELSLLEAGVSELRKLVEQKSEAADRVDRKRREYRRTLETNRNDLERLHQDEMQLREAMLSSLFPKLSDYGSYALSNLLSKHCCIVCGSNDETHLENARLRLEATSDCPLCHSDISLQEVSETVEVNSENKKRLEALSDSKKHYAGAVRDLELRIKNLSQEYLKLEEERWTAESEYNDLNQKLAIARRAIEHTGGIDVAAETQRLQEFERTIADYRAEKTSALKELLEVINGVAENVEVFKDSLIHNFGVYIDAFMAERCELRYRREARNLGQLSSSVDLLYPEFHVSLTSGVYTRSGSAREAANAVSESQMEFIELAFRMSLLATAASTDAVTLIMETPEASLDAVFIPRAGASLNKFAYQATSKHSTLITSSNLNGSEMISALLGTINSPKKLLPAEVEAAPLDIDISGRVLNLLTCAAKNAALVKFGDEYQRRFKLAINAQNKEQT